VRADIISMAKGMGNGFPVGGILSSPAIAPWHGMLGTTFGGNYLACVAASAVLEVLAQEQLTTLADERGTRWMAALAQVPGVQAVRGHGLMIGVQLDRPAAAVRKQLLEQHAMFTGNASEPNTLRLLPPLNLPEAQMAAFTQALTQVLTHA
jgi:acetylornithine aminotransferase